MNIATIGTSFITEWFLKATKQIDGMECTAMYSRKKENAESLAKAYGVSQIYTDLDEMLQAETIDMVYVASPNSLHYEYSMKALQAGKHVICEKPFTSTVKEFETLVQYAKEHQRFLFEAIVTMHMPNYKTLKTQLSQLGQIRMVQCNFSQYSSRYDAFQKGDVPNVFNPAFSGGALADINIYNLHFVMGLFGKPENVHYYPNKHENGIDTSGVVILEYDGFQAVCVGCKDTKSMCISQIQGEKGYVTLESETSKCSNLTLHVGNETTDLSTTQNENALYYELLDFKAMIEHEDYLSCYNLLNHSAMVMDVFEAARKSGNIIFSADNIA